ncbi:Crp/Fnr family transcriptional regulator [Sphingomonas morindae]|uniref:Crp/Fnr family transcriptional regulator n=1 Tax=Sphingomonas morindae TaxID=1541170 RepID=A0ABY4X9N1_9SPHN|nr:Crp/Fnr family transcriptional regulator [Sphingomonas morindae]USI73431.1 Crp/Fnr family transcriptional regulator [Sphingomonas morindae]
MLMRTSSLCAQSRNRFLAHLSRDDAALLDSGLERVAVPPGGLLTRSGAPLDLLYFPETAIVSIGYRLGGDRQVEAAVVGNEGVVGWSAITGAGFACHDAVVQMTGGTAWRIARADLDRACAASATLLAALIRFADVVTVQMTQAILSLVHDTVEKRLCRWLLMRHDRVATDQLLVRHAEISANLGTRRASVTDGLHVLEGERLVRCYRGRILIRDRMGLEREAADSYGVSEAHYRRQIAPFGRSETRAAEAGLAPAGQRLRA